MGLPRRIAIRLKRMIEAPPPRERTVVKVVPAQEVPHMPAGFIVGVYRSGTTLLRYILDSHSRIAVPPESNFLVTLSELFTLDGNRKGLQGVGLDEVSLIQSIRDYAGGIFDAYAEAKGKRRWFDKTPAYAEILDFLQSLFGLETRYVMLYRHGLDVAHSLTQESESGTIFAAVDKRYPTEFKISPRIAFVKYWNEVCEKMMRFEADHPQQCFRLHYEDYCTDPGGQLKPVFEYLGEPWEPAVLDFASKSHDFGLQDNKIIETQRFQPSIGNYKVWRQEDIAAAVDIAGSVLDRLGYEV